jgi:hypothetical protein
MNYSDEELQRAIENKNIPDNSPDARAYQKVFDALAKEPYQLPGNFADNVISRLEVKKTSLFRDYFWLALGLLPFIIATVITIVLTGFTIDFSAYRFISGYAGFFFFGAAFILFIQYLDRRLVGRRAEF